MKLTNEAILKSAEQYESLVVSIRRTLHEHPEVSLHEVNTKKLILSHIKELGLPYIEVGQNSVIATLDTGKSGKTILLRADMDALPMQESPNNLCGAKVSVSKVDGVCHACGHDGHTAMLIGAMHILSDHRDELCGKIMFCFEEAEENMKGIYPIMDALKPYHIDGAWGIHLTAMHPSGKVSVNEGGVMAGANRFTVKIKGRGGHGSRPDQSISPIFGAAQILTALPSAWVNEVNITKTVSLGIGMIHGGKQENIIPDEVSFSGSMRFFDEEASLQAVEAFKRICTLTAQAHRCEAQFIQMDIIQPPPVINDSESAQMAQKAIVDILGEDHLIHADPWFGSESMALYLKAYTGVLAFVGIANPKTGSGAVHHNEKFDIDESALKIGTIATVKYATEFLSK